MPPASEVWKASDTDADGLLSKAEFPKFTPAFWFGVADLDGNGTLTHDEWAAHTAPPWSPRTGCSRFASADQAT